MRVSGKVHNIMWRNALAQMDQHDHAIVKFSEGGHVDIEISVEDATMLWQTVRGRERVTATDHILARLYYLAVANDLIPDAEVEADEFMALVMGESWEVRP